MIGYSIIGWIGPIVMTALCWALFRKAGLRGGILAVTFLPIVGGVVSTVMSMAIIGMALGDLGYFVVATLIGMTFHLSPLIVLLAKDWFPKTDDDVFR